MILTFNRDIFVKRIKNGMKKHSIRKDRYNRWKKGMTIHFWRGNPRNVKSKPYKFGVGIVYEIANIEIYPCKNIVKISFNKQSNQITSKEELNNLAINDGFDNWEEMKEFFNKDIKGKMIFWSGCRRV
jgi:hypothetical protein